MYGPTRTIVIAILSLALLFTLAAAPVAAQAPPPDPRQLLGSRWEQLPAAEQDRLLGRYRADRREFEVAMGRPADLEPSGRSAASLLAEPGWDQVGPEGGIVEALTVDPNNAAVWYAASRAALYKSTDSGQTWTDLHVPLGDNDLYSAGIAVHPLDSDRVYVSDRYSVYRSADGGLTWTQESTRLNNQTLYTYALDVDPSAVDGVYIAGYYYDSGTTHLAFAHSSDGGATWSRQSLMTLSGSGRLMDIEVDGDRIYVLGNHYEGSNQRVVAFRSDDLTQPWIPIYESQSDTYSYPEDLGVNHTTGTVYLAGSLDEYSHGLLRSTDHGATWADAVSNGSFDAVYASGTMTYAIDYRFLWSSDDDGVTWEQGVSIVPPSSRYGNATALVVPPTAPSLLVAGSYYSGVRRSTDGGATWTTSSTGYYGVYTNGLAVHPTSRQTLFLAATVAYKSTDGGATWAVLDGVYGNDVAIDPNDPTTVYVRESNDFYRSTDGGTTWTEVSIQGQIGQDLSYGWRNSMAVDPADGSIHIGAYSYDDERAVMITSEDGGDTWSLRQLSGQDRINAVLAPGDGQVYLGGYQDDGQTNRPPIVYAVPAAAGATTEARHVLEPGANYGYIYSLAVAASGDIYAGGYSYGYDNNTNWYRSLWRFDGTAWTAVRQTQSYEYIYGIGIVPAESALFLAGRFSDPMPRSS